MNWRPIDTVNQNEDKIIVLCEGKFLEFGTVKNGEVLTLTAAKPYFFLRISDLPDMPDVPSPVFYDHLD